MESDELTPHPFQVEYDAEEEEYFIFAPPGCVLVDGKAVEIADVDSAHNVALDLDPDDLPDNTLWAHVTADSSATGGYKVEFDGNSTKSGAKWSFRVCGFGAADNDGNQYDVCSSVVCLSSGKRVPGNFEPTFEDDNGTMKLAHVGNGYVPFGRKFYYVLGDNRLDDSAKIATGTVYLEVTHTTSGQPTIYIKGSSSAVDFTQASTSVSLIPLYEITNGAMTLDYRSCMSLTVREV